MCSTISIPIFPKIPKIILRKLSNQFGDFGLGHSAKNWEMWQLLRLIQWRLHISSSFFNVNQLEINSKSHDFLRISQNHSNICRSPGHVRASRSVLTIFSAVYRHNTMRLRMIWLKSHTRCSPCQGKGPTMVIPLANQIYLLGAFWGNPTLNPGG